MRFQILILILSAWTSTASAGLISSLSAQDRHYMECEASVEAAGDVYAQQATAWQNCLDSAQAKGFDTLLPDLKGRVAFAAAFAEAEKQSLSGTARDELIFRQLAEEKNARFPLSTLSATMRSYLLSTEGRSRFSPYRDLTLRWLPTDSLKSAGKEHVNEVLRRHIEDANFRWAAHGSSAGAQADVVVIAQLSHRELEPEGDSFRPVLRVEYEIKASRVELKARDKRVEGFTSSAIGRGATLEEAHKNALNAAAQKASAAVLQSVIQEAFRPRNTTR